MSEGSPGQKSEPHSNEVNTVLTVLCLVTSGRVLSTAPTWTAALVVLGIFGSSSIVNAAVLKCALGTKYGDTVLSVMSLAILSHLLGILPWPATLLAIGAFGSFANVTEAVLNVFGSVIKFASKLCSGNGKDEQGEPRSAQ